MAALVGVVALVGGAHAAMGGPLSDYRLLLLGGSFAKWGSPTPGTGAVVTYAVTAATADFADAINCKAIEPVDDLLAANAIDRAAFDGELAAALHAWASVANVSFLPAAPETADILIGAQAEPHGRAFTNVYMPEIGGGAIRSIGQSVICLNPAEHWKIGFDGNLDVYDLRYTLMHEVGHAIGLDHPGSRGEVMDFRYREEFTQLQAGDIAGADALYGPSRLVVGAAQPPGLMPGIATARR